MTTDTITGTRWTNSTDENTAVDFLTTVPALSPEGGGERRVFGCWVCLRRKCRYLAMMASFSERWTDVDCDLALEIETDLGRPDVASHAKCVANFPR
jgi:hypothetical protein